VATAAEAALLARRQMADYRNGIGAAYGQTQTARLLSQLADVEVFQTPDGRAYVTIAVRGHYETLAVDSTRFRNWLAVRFYVSERDAANSWAVQDVLAVISAKAQFDGIELPVHIRVAESGDAIYLDLGDSAWRAVEITPSGRSILSRPPVRFRRSRGMLALPAPVPGGHISDLRRFINVKDDDWILFVMWLIAALRPKGPYPILGLYGEQGSAKTTIAKVARHLVDPFKAPTRSLPRSERDLMINASNSHILAFDNISRLDPWHSDSICRLSTGGGMSTRQLYTDEEETIFDVQRPVLLNGIEEDVAVNGDLLDRMVDLVLPEIGEKDREDEEKFWKEFEAVRPQILGALLDAVSAALKNLPTVKLERLPRMADFAKWAAAAECALGFKAGEFIRAYNRNRSEVSAVALESSPVGASVEEFMQKQKDWTGTNGELLRSLKEPSGRAFTIGPKALSIALARAKPSLRNVGITIQRLPREAGTGRRLIKLEKRSTAV
jgi:hypothetical protein